MDFENDFGIGPPQPEEEPETSLEAAYQEPPLQDRPVEDESSEIDDQMCEAERRIHKAMLYRQFLTEPVFDGDDSPLTAEVCSEFRAFARHQLSQLLGVGGPALPFGAQFSESEVKILRMVVESMSKNAKVAKVLAQDNKKQPAQEQAPPPPAQPPRLRTRQVAAKQTPRREPQQPAIEQPASRQQALRPSQPQAQAPAQAQQAQSTPDAPPPVLPADGEIFAYKGKKFKAVWREMSSTDYGPEMEKLIDKIQPDGHKTLPNGIQIVRATGGDLFKVIRQDLTVQAKDPKAIPMPNRKQMEFISQSKAVETATKNFNNVYKQF
jgi:hypothetical protein